MFQDLFQRLTGYVPQMLAALLVFVVGWLLALIISRIVRAILHRAQVDHRISEWVQGDDTARSEIPHVEQVVGAVVFWILMLLVLVAVFNILNLGGLAAPFNVFLNQVAAYAPRLISVVFLVLLAWVVATVLRIIVRAALGAVRFDERLRTGAGVTEDDTKSTPVPSLANTIANTVYWLVFLFFLPAILDALDLPGLLVPVQGLVNQVLVFLPNLALAVLIALAGWFIARIVQRIVSNILYATGIDNIGEEAGFAAVTGERRISEVLGFIAYVLVLIVVVTLALDTLKLGAITAPISNMLNQILLAIPNIFAAILLMILAYVAAKLLAGVVANILAGLGFDRLVMRLGQSVVPSTTSPAQTAAPSPDLSTGTRSPSEVVGTVALVAIMLFASVEALNLVGFTLLAGLVAQFIVFAGRVVLGLIIFGIGLYVANLAAQLIWSGGGKNAGLMALAARVSILVLAGAMALRQMGLAPEIIQTAFTLLLGAVAIAVALAFGLGSRDVAGGVVKDWVRQIEAGNGTDLNPMQPTAPSSEAGQD